MMEVLRFVFSSFWIWLGTVIILGIVASPLAGLITIIRRPKASKRVEK